jgi:glycosyltransferase involved in cell wall biosynthesis
VNILQEYRHVIVYLNRFAPLRNEFVGDVEFICLDHGGWASLPGTAAKLKGVIKDKDPVLVHSHLFVSSFIARLAAPQSVPLFTSLHSIFSIDAFQKNKRSLWIERLTLKKRHNLIAVSKFVLDDYLHHVSFKGNRFVLYNFLPEPCFQPQAVWAPSGGLKCVAIGNLKEAKNYDYLLEIFSSLRNTGISLDIYGEGVIKEQLQQKIDRFNLPVRLLGKAVNVKALFKHYHLFVQASSHEGFGISVIEAMAAKLPVLISDIPVFREVSAGQAHFFTVTNPRDASEVFMNLLQNATERTKYVEAAFKYCSEVYAEKSYKEKLLSIYNSCLRGPKFRSS